jgi:hypothetical protein
MARLTSVHGSFGAHVLAARLVSEGFDVELRGAIDSPYALTMGDLALVDVYVPADQVHDASYVLLVNEVDVTLDEDPEESRRSRVTPIARVVAAALIATALLSLLHSVF